MKSLHRRFHILSSLLLMITIAASSFLYAQVIRKNYREFTDGERQAYINALYTLRSNGKIQEYANIHNVNFDNGIHNSNMFPPWHREFIRRFELELKSVNSTINLPYWDWTSTNPNDQSGDSSVTLLWNSQWLGPFNNLWQLNRSLSGTFPWTPPSVADIDAILAINNYDTFAYNNPDFPNDLEDHHDRVHVWVAK